MPDIDTSLLQAVNTMLSLIGEAPVNSLENAGSADVALALRTLQEEDRALQARGWHWNTDRNLTLTPDEFGRYPWEVDWIRFDTRVGEYTDVDIVRRGEFLWNAALGTDVFKESSLKGEVVLYIDWTDIPETARHYVMVRSARIFLNRTMGDELRAGYAASDEQAAWRLLIEAEDEQADYSYRGGYPQMILRKQSGRRFPFAHR